MYRHPLEDRDKLTPRQALDILIEGNQRFKNNVKREHDMLSVRDVIKEKQHPFASVLGSVIPERLLNLFLIRT